MARTFLGRSLISAIKADLDLLWRRISAIDYVVDADRVLDPAIHASVQVWSAPLTAHRNVFPPAGAQTNSRFRIVHNSANTDAFLLQVYAGPNAGTALLIQLDYFEWCEIENDGAAYVLTAVGHLTPAISDIRFTEDNDTRITEDGDLRVTESLQ